MRRLGLFGGTFDPPHLGHLALAENARERLELERVVFMPSGVPPHKRGRRISSAADRIAMTRLAVRGNPAFTVSALETRRRGASYTVDTLRALGRAHPGVRLYLLVGEDSLAEFSTWHEPDAILALATMVVAPRPGKRAPVSRAHPSRTARRRPRVIWLDHPELDVSSSAIRARARSGRSIRYVVPDAVARYIERQGLYGRAR